MSHDDLMQAAKSGRRLAGPDIKTMKDLDVYRYQQVLTKKGEFKPGSSILSRYRTMVNLYGQRRADAMMRELEIRAWDLPGKK